MKRHFPIAAATTVRWSVILVWVVLFAMLLMRDSFVRSIGSDTTEMIERARRSEFQGIYFNDRKIGYVEQHFSPADNDTLRVSQQAVMTLNISGQSYPVDLNLEAVIDPRSRLKSFQFSFSSPFYEMRANGAVSGKTVTYTLDTGSNEINDSLELPDPPLLPTSRRGYLLNGSLKPGDKIRIPWFDPLSLTSTSSLVEYRGKEKTLIRERVYNLHQFSESYSGVRVNVWLDDDGVVVKEESPAGFVFVREPEFKAKEISGRGDDDLLAAVSIPVDGNMPDTGGRASMRYRLTLPEGQRFDIDTGRQSFADQVLTVTRESVPTAAVPGGCAGDDSALAASPYIQSTDPEIIARAETIIGERNDGTERVRALSRWVYDTIDKRPVIGIPDAKTTMKNGIGDCNEHASLFAALARSVGIPAKIAVGVVWNRDAFYYHAWNEVCLSGSWISVDTTTNQLPADLTHLKFVEGELQEQIRIGSLINNLRITPLPDEHASRDAK